MQCPKCHNEVAEDAPVCVSCKTSLGTCTKCGRRVHFIEISLPQIIEKFFALVLLGLSLNYSRVVFKQCALCNNTVQICIKCGNVFKGMNKCPYCRHTHFVGVYSIVDYFGSILRGGR
jgi:hypothetical protein